MIRLLAISQTLCQQANGASHARLIPEALALTAACVWLLNGLHARPEDGPAARRLMDATFPLSEAQALNPDVFAYNTSRRAGWQEEEEEGEEGCWLDAGVEVRGVGGEGVVERGVEEGGYECEGGD